MKEDLPWPVKKKARDLADSYLRDLYLHSPSTVAMAEQIKREKPLALSVVLTPFLATDDLAQLANYFAQYAKQSFQDFTVILFPNASLEVDPARKAIEESVAEIGRLQRLYPHLDVRFMLDPTPDETFVSIGKLRKLLWDAALMRGDEDSRNKKLPSHYLNETYSLSQAVNVYHALNPDYFFLNHDVDVVHMPKHFMKTFIEEMVFMSIAQPPEVKPPNVFNCSMAHARSEDHPQIDALVAVHDYLYNSISSGFEAGMAIRSTTYASLGGFRSDSHTYEVAGFAKLDKSLMHFVKGPKITTNPRRMYERLPSVNMYEVWGSREANDKAVFNDKDVCRKRRAEDITPERKEALFTAWREKEDFSYFLSQAALLDALYLPRYRYRELVRIYRYAENTETKREVRQAIEAALRHALHRRSRVFERLLHKGGFANATSIVEKLHQKAEGEIHEFVEDTVYHLETFSDEAA